MLVRVVSGVLKGRRLVAPEGTATRPTSDRVRESIFNALGSIGAVDQARVVDMFAGSGAMGIEALSRGASECTFVEQSRVASDVIGENLRSLDLAGSAQVVAKDVLTYLGSAPRFDLALIDPPYEFDRWDELLGDLDAGVAVIESNRLIEVPPKWSTVREKHYGTTVVLIARLVPGHARGHR